MTPLQILFTLLPLVWATGAAAAALPPADLPPPAAVAATLAALPGVRAAEAEQRGALAEQARLKAGEHEYGVALTAQRRNVAGGPDYNEWSAAVERGLRLPGKARLDQRIGAQGVIAAEERVGDARHEAARQLLGLWYAALQAQAETRLWREQTDLLAEELRLVEVRVRRGDAARIDSLQAEAALAQARSRSTQAEAREKSALAELRARYPELPAPADSQAEPALPDGGEAEWIAHTLEHNHELLAAQAAAEQARLRTRRAESERLPDPFLGVHAGSEAGGDERILGLGLRLALPGKGRQAVVERHLAEAEALAEMEAATRRRLAAEAAVNWQRAVAGTDGYPRLKEAATAMNRHADLARRAHELGELGLSETLVARRNAVDGQLIAEQARLAANEAIARLLLDAHRLWPLGGDEAHH